MKPCKTTIQKRKLAKKNSAKNYFKMTFKRGKAKAKNRNSLSDEKKEQNSDRKNLTWLTISKKCQY